MLKKISLSFICGVICCAIAFSLIGASRGLGKVYATIAISDTGTVSVPLAYCDESLLMILNSRGGATTLDLDKSAAAGIICNVAVADNYNVTVKSTSAVIIDNTGTPQADVVCTDDGGNDAYGCFASFVKLSSGLWTLTRDPYGNWIW